MLTQLETETLSLIKSVCRAILAKLDGKKQIDWEQRRYEIAKDCLAAHSSSAPDILCSCAKDYYASHAVSYADELIKQLREHEKAD